MKLFFITVFMFSLMSSAAQKKAIFSSQNYVGLLEGEQKSKLQLQTINGIKYRTWFIGLGTGIDWYYLRSIPIFLSLNRDFLQKKNRNFFVALNGGVNLPWKKNNDLNELGYPRGRLLTGFYWEGGLGYKIGIGKRNNAMLLQLAYNYKHLGEKTITRVYDTPELDPAERFDYYLRRLSMKIGWKF